MFRIGTPKWLLAVLLLTVGLVAAEQVSAAEVVQDWQLIVPTGVVEKIQVDPAARIASLEGKTVALRWNGKNNGDVMLDRLAELIAKGYPNTKVIKTWHPPYNLGFQTANTNEAKQVTDVIKSLNADIIIASQAD